MPKGHTVTKKQVNKIMKLREKGKSYAEIAEALGIASKTVSHLVNKHRPELAVRADTLRIKQKDGSPPAKAKKKAERKAKKRKAGKPGPKAGARYLALKDENDYLRWAYTGAVNNWVDRLIDDHGNGKLG